MPTSILQAQVLVSTATPSNSRRRRRRSSSEPTERDRTTGSPIPVDTAGEGGQARRNTRQSDSGSRRERPSSPKRLRLMSRDMRVDPDKPNSSSNGVRHYINGSSLPPLQKSIASNSYAHSLNGHLSSYTNGSAAVASNSRPSTYYGHDREEISRLLIQALNDLGYQDTANRLIHESGYELESPSVAAFRHAILDGEWSEAEALLFGSNRPDTGGGVSISNGNGSHHAGLILAEGVDKDGLRFLLRKQKYLELLEDRDHGGALMVLRQELTPLHQDVGQLHILSGQVSPFNIGFSCIDQEHALTFG